MERQQTVGLRVADNQVLGAKFGKRFVFQKFQLLLLVYFRCKALRGKFFVTTEIKRQFVQLKLQLQLAT